MATKKVVKKTVKKAVKKPETLKKKITKKEVIVVPPKPTVNSIDVKDHSLQVNFSDGTKRRFELQHYGSKVFLREV